MNSKDERELLFEEITEAEMFADYTAGCSGSQSACCTRTCTRIDDVASEEEWGKFLEIEGGVIQY